ncbi:MAG: hypothetical protein ACTHN4_01005 [Sphingomicrobium sp.]
MLVYGDHSETTAPADRIARLRAAAQRCSAMPPGLERHAAIASLLIEGGRLLQGIADAEFERARMDDPGPGTKALSEWLIAIGAAFTRSWDSGFEDAGDLPRAPTPEALPDRVTLRHPEGYAFYALYPEAYLGAARKVRLLGPARVIGIRSIGTSLGAVVAAALGQHEMLTVRPFGDPSAREIAISDDARSSFAIPHAHYLIVDEGPGRSGSSFAAVADWLQSTGIPARRITLLPSHAAEPAAASPNERQRWLRRERIVADLSPELPDLLRRWLLDRIGPVERMEDISAGRWREQVYRCASEWPPVFLLWERHKFLAWAGGKRWLVKFAGLGRIGERKLERARLLSSHGLVPRPAALIHGFLVSEWQEGQPLSVSEKPLAEIAEYLAARSRLFPGGSGASAGALLEMARRNISLALGPEASASLDYWEPKLSRLDRATERVGIDGRMESHEWIRTPSGKLLKTDALDHDCAHDLVGCQDIGWDVAGAIVEFELSAAESGSLTHALERLRGRAVDGELLKFLTTAYLAFRIGQCTICAEAEPTDSAEQARLVRARARYENALARLLPEKRRKNERPSQGVGVEPQRNSLRNNPAMGSVQEEEAVPSF